MWLVWLTIFAIGHLMVIGNYENERTFYDIDTNEVYMEKHASDTLYVEDLV